MQVILTACNACPSASRGLNRKVFIISLVVYFWGGNECLISLSRFEKEFEANPLACSTNKYDYSTTDGVQSPHLVNYFNIGMFTAVLLTV